MNLSLIVAEFWCLAIGMHLIAAYIGYRQIKRWRLA